jgi:hypothetical protein
MRGRAPALALLAFALAGCAQDTPDADGEDAAVGTLVEGWVVDLRIMPVVGANVSASAVAWATTAEDGHYAVRVPSGQDVIVTIVAPGFEPASKLVSAGSGQHTFLNFTLAPRPSQDPRILVQSFNGAVRCAVTAVAGEDPSRPHEHQGFRCDDNLPGEVRTNVWNFTYPADADGLVAEVFWDAQSEVSKALYVRLTHAPTGEVLAFAEAMDPIRLQPSVDALAQLQRLGDVPLQLTVGPGAGTGNHDHGAVGAFVEQQFEAFSSTFFDRAVDPSYTVDA